jgi:hypothetical protein
MIYNILCTIFSDIITITQRQTDPVRDELYTAIAKVEKVLISEKGKITSFGTSEIWENLFSELCQTDILKMR